MILQKNNQEVLVKYTGDPLCGLSENEFLEKIKQHLRNRVEEAFVFGSFASGALHRDSDIDLLLITQTELPFPERNRLFEDLLDIGPELDILVYTPEEFQRIKAQPTAGFWKSVIGNMKRILP